MKKLLFVCVAFTCLFVSCGKNSSEFKALQARSDSLELAGAKSNAELEEVLSILNEVEDNFKSIKSAENYLMVQSTGTGEMTLSTRNRIANDMQLITETLKKNKDQIAQLESKLKKSSVNSVQLQKTLEGLRNELSEKTMALVSLQNELADRNQKIDELNESVSHLSSDVQALRTQSYAQQETISQQKTALNTIYYCFGTSKELKIQKILIDGQLGSNFNKNYFIRVKDAKDLKEVPLYTKKAKLITKHPDNSYEFVKDESGNIVFKIVDVKNFWSLGKYMVIQVH